MDLFCFLNCLICRSNSVLKIQLEMLSAWKSNIIASCYIHSLCYWQHMFLVLCCHFCWCECEANSLQVNLLLHWATAIIPAYESSGFMYVGGGCLRAVSPLVSVWRGAGPFLQLLVSSLSPLGKTAEAVAAPPCPGEAMERDRPHTRSALRALAYSAHSSD